MTRYELAPGLTAFPGHGLPQSPGQLTSAQRDYRLTLAALVKELSDGRASLPDAAKAEIESRMKARYPGHALAFLVVMSVDPIACELAHGLGEAPARP